MIGLLIKKLFLRAQCFVDILDSNDERGQSGGR